MDSEETAEVRDVEPQDGPLFDANGQEIGQDTSKKAAGNGLHVDSEVARLNTKIAALATKVDVLSASLERVQAQKSQPVIEAEPQAHSAESPIHPQANLAAPLDLPTEVEEPAQIHVSAAPARAASLPVSAKQKSTASVSSGAEKEFRSAMQLFQNGQNLEAASRFALVAKKFPGHLLAGHALYWAGEAASRGQQMALAGDNWAELEKRYPRSAYLPEALAGLAKVYDSQGDSSKAAHYRSLLARSFPKSPVALRLDSASTTVAASKGNAHTQAARSPLPATHVQEESSAEEAPLFETTEENTSPSTENQ